MFGITPFGMFHTVVSLIALFAGLIALVRYREIDYGHLLGKVYVWFTIGSCVTGFFIFRHGGFGKPHALGVITLLVLFTALAADRKATFGRLSRYVAAIGYSLTVFFHLIPGFTETATRIPEGRPLVSGPDAPELQAAVGAAFLVFLAVALLQALRIRRQRAPLPQAA